MKPALKWLSFALAFVLIGCAIHHYTASHHEVYVIDYLDDSDDSRLTATPISHDKVRELLANTSQPIAIEKRLVRTHSNEYMGETTSLVITKSNDEYLITKAVSADGSSKVKQYFLSAELLASTLENIYADVDNNVEDKEPLKFPFEKFFLPTKDEAGVAVNNNVETPVETVDTKTGEEVRETSANREGRYKPITLLSSYKHDKWRTRPRDHIVHFRAYTVSFDGVDDSDNDGDQDDKDMIGQPEWVSYHIKRSPKLTKAPDRPSTWIEDKELKAISPNDSTYRNSGYVRGHLCMKFIAWRLGSDADWNTHTTLNAMPQIQRFNAGVWYDMEVKTQKWADLHGEIWVICGGAWDKTKRVKYIGDGKEMKIPVPHYFWKIVVREVGGELNVLCFLYPHTVITKNSSGSYPHEQYLISIDKLEAVTGLDFFTTLDDSVENELEKVKATKIWKW